MQKKEGTKMIEKGKKTEIRFESPSHGHSIFSFFMSQPTSPSSLSPKEIEREIDKYTHKRYLEREMLLLDMAISTPSCQS